MDERVRVRDRRRRGWFHVDNDVVDRFAPIVGSSGLATYMALCRRGNATSSCQVGLNRLAMDAGLGRSAVKVAIRKLDAVGLIEIRERWKDGGQQVHEYILLDVRDAAGRLPEPDPEDWSAWLEGRLKSDLPPSVGNRPTLGRNPTDPQSESDHKEKSTQEKTLQEERLAPRELNRIIQETTWNLANGHTVASLIASGMLDAEVWERVRVTPEARRAKLDRAK